MSKPKTCRVCGALYDPTALTCDCLLKYKMKVKDARRDAAKMSAACIALMGGPGWLKEYECEHGVPVAEDCKVPNCHLERVRYVRKTLSVYESRRDLVE